MPVTSTHMHCNNITIHSPTLSPRCCAQTDRCVCVSLTHTHMSNILLGKKAKAAIKQHSSTFQVCEDYLRAFQHPKMPAFPCEALHTGVISACTFAYFMVFCLMTFVGMNQWDVHCTYFAACRCMLCACILFVSLTVLSAFIWMA